MQKFIIVGAGGAAREIYHSIRKEAKRRISVGEPPCECVGFLQDVAYNEKIAMPDGYPQIIGSIHGYTPDPEYRYILGIGGPENRYHIANLFRDYWELFPTFIHPMAAVTDLDHFRSGHGTYVSGGVSCDVTFGNFVLENGGNHGHDVVVEDYCEIGPFSSISGHVHLDRGVHIGANCSVAPGVHIGAWSKISACTAVMKDIPPCSYVVGVPGKIYKNFFESPE